MTNEPNINIDPPDIYINVDSINDILREVRLSSEIDIKADGDMLGISGTINGEPYEIWEEVMNISDPWYTIKSLIGEAIGNAVMDKYIHYDDED